MSIKRIKNLVKQLNEYRHAYYNQDAPLVSDAEYDRLFDKLKKLENRLVSSCQILRHRRLDIIRSVNLPKSPIRLRCSRLRKQN